MGKYFLRRLLGFFALLIGSSPWVVNLIGADTLLQLFGYPDWMKSMREFFQHPPLYFFPLLLVLSVAGFAFGYWLESRSEKDKFEEEWNGLQFERKTLFRLLDRALEKWWRDGSPIRSKDFARRAGFPNDVLAVFSDLYGYVEKALKNWPEEQRRLLEFCVAVYPEKGNSLLFSSPAEEEQLDKARMALSKFWDKWGRACFEKQTMLLRHISPQIRESSVSHLILLTYLEVAAARPAEETGEGKQRLFKMAKHFRDNSNFK